MTKKQSQSSDTFSNAKNNFTDIQKKQIGEIFIIGDLEFCVRNHSGSVLLDITKKTITNVSTNYAVYRKTGSDQQWMIDEGQANSLAEFFGYKLFDIEITHALPVANYCYNFIAKASVREPGHLGGEEYSCIASASPSNLKGFSKDYGPEMAQKRASVRCILRAMKIFGLLYEGELKDPVSVPNQFIEDLNIGNVKQQSIYQNKSQQNNNKRSEKIIISENKKERQIITIKKDMLNKPKFGNISEKQALLGTNKNRLEDCSEVQLGNIIKGLNNNFKIK